MGLTRERAFLTHADYSAKKGVFLAKQNSSRSVSSSSGARRRKEVPQDYGSVKRKKALVGSRSSLAEKKQPIPYKVELPDTR